MSIAPVSMLPRSVRLAAAFLLTFPAAAVLAQDMGSKHPNWGLADFSVLTLFAWDFEPVNPSTVTAEVSPKTLRQCVSELPCRLASGVHLPNGALIEFMEYSVCDEDPVGNALATLDRNEDPEGGGFPLATIVTAGSGGCFRWTSGFIGEIVDNLTNSYSIHVLVPPGLLSFRAVRLFYRLQVSPAPNVASFDDVPVGSPYHAFVEALRASGITVGCGGGNYCPDESLTRGQMAVFLSKALGLYWPN